MLNSARALISHKDVSEFCFVETVRHHETNAGESDADRRLIEAIRRALCTTGYPALRGLDLEIRSGVVVLWGRVTTYHQKQLAQATAHGVEGVRGIANEIEVIGCR